jgi:signal transduction histidine kinase
MFARALHFVDWFIPEQARRSRSDLGRARTFVFTHLVGPTTAASIDVFLFLADPSPGIQVVLIAIGIASFWLLPLMLRVTGNLRLVAYISVQMLITVTLYGVYHFGGVSSPFLPWLLIALANGFFYLSDRPFSILTIFVLNVTAFVAIWLLTGTLPQRVPMEQMTLVGIVSVASATLYMAWLAIYYGRLLTSESDLEREALRHRHTSERLAAAKDKAERANREKSIFLAKMSHELRTPLNAVIGYSEILQEDADLDCDEQRSKDLSRINAAGKHLLSLVADILDITRIESNEIELQIAEFEVKRLIEDVVATSEPLVEAHGNKLELRIDRDVGCMVSDELRLRQAALNLMSNAAKFTTKGMITLSCRRYRTEAGDWIEIEVRDTGIGIAHDDLKNLFQDFRQINQTATRKSKGTGLGLALSQKLCTIMGGGISADSELGHGASFTIRVPARLAVAAGRKNDNSSIDALVATASAA